MQVAAWRRFVFFSGKIPILGICLGHQAIAYALGNEVTQGHRPRHGKISKIQIQEDPLFLGMQDLNVGRYHALIVSRPLVDTLREIATSEDDGFVMAIRVKNTQTWGVQFHPESVLSQEGVLLFKNFFRQLETGDR